MSEDDIYKQREPMPYGSGQNRKRFSNRRRSSGPKRAFDDPSRKRRSRNSGLRRLLHLYRKKESEKIFWWTTISILVVFLVALALWQFVFRYRDADETVLPDGYEYVDPGDGSAE